VTSSLYIHIPVCLKKCDYCDFFSVPVDALPKTGASAPGEDCLERLVAGLCREIDWWHKRYRITAWKTVYIGGGTPSLLSPRNITTLCTKIDTLNKKGLSPYSEWTIEANPEDITEDWLRACSDAGINRLSIGVQSLDNASLAAVNRRGNKAKTLAALAMVSRIWKGRLSLDMIAGLPGQTAQSLVEDLSRLLAFNPDHLSLYSLTIEDETPLSLRIREKTGPVLPDEDEATDIWLAGRDYLRANGFTQYEVSNFCRPGSESQHNLTYWNLESYIGVGPGATGTIVEGDTATRYTDSRDIAQWLDNSEAGRETEDIGRDESMKEVLLMGMRLAAGIDKKAFQNRFGTELLSCIPKTAARWIHNALLQDSDERIALTPEGLLYLNRFLADCMEELDAVSQRNC